MKATLYSSFHGLGCTKTVANLDECYDFAAWANKTHIHAEGCTCGGWTFCIVDPLEDPSDPWVATMVDSERLWFVSNNWLYDNCERLYRRKPTWRPN